MAPDNAGQVYDKIGTGDTARRQADSRLARLLFAALGLGRVPNNRPSVPPGREPRRLILPRV